MSTEAEKQKAYVSEKQLHHLFELLATKALSERPANVFSFLRDQLTIIEEGESRNKAHDPSKIMFEEKSQDLAQLKITLAVFGVDNAGKTAFIHALGGQVENHTTPTVGFSPTHFETDRFKLCLFDLGGGKNFRGIWPHYYHDCHGIIYVLDAADAARYKENAKVFNEVASHKYVKGKPMLVFANKSDLPNAKKNPEEVMDLLELGKELREGAVKVASCCALELHGDANNDIDAGTEWMLEHIQKNYEELSKMVNDHTQEVQEEKKRKREELLRGN